MQKLTLIILAAGIGSRYGSLKQLDKMSPEGDTIIDFSIYDAIEAGFSKIVFVVRENFKKDFKTIFDSKWKNKIELVYVCQELNNISTKLNNSRTKPLGTGHALLVAKHFVNSNFAVINADDFYGNNAFKIMANKLQLIDKKATTYYMIGYRLKNTVSKYGAVSRGQCFTNTSCLLETIIERTHISNNGTDFLYKEDDSKMTIIDKETIVSMNFWGFTPQIFSYLENEFQHFLLKNNTNLTKEFFIPTVINTLLKKNKASVEVILTDEKWLGVTYLEDKKTVTEAIIRLKNQKKYPKFLW